MEYMSDVDDTSGTVGKILCCQCGVPIEPNPANMCVPCLRTHVDITEGIPKQGTLYFCKACERYLKPPAEWVSCCLESRELLALCLQKLKGLNRVKLVDAGFVWTEPHSKRIKVKLTVHGEVLSGTILQQVFVVEFTVNNQMCEDCHRVEAKNFWRCVVQVRQRVENRKTLYYLEQLILKHKAHDAALGIKQIHDGLDFYYSTHSLARKMVDFLNSVIPCRHQQSKRLISQDVQSNICNYKHTFSVEIIPLCKHGLVCLPKKLANQLGGISPVCLISRVTKVAHLIDPSTAQIAEISGSVFFREPFNMICVPKQLLEYIVMDVEVNDQHSFPGQGAVSKKHVVADVWVVKAADLGVSDNIIHTRSHLGYILKPGDSVLGYSLADSNANDDNFDKLKKDYVPDVILVKKHYADASARRRQRNWKLKHLNEQNSDLGTNNSEYNEFLEELEEDPVIRQNVNIYKDNRNVTVDRSDVDDGGAFPRISLAEMLDDLHLDDVEMTEQ